MPSCLSSFAFGDTAIRFPYDEQTGRIGLELVPLALEDQVVPRRPGLAGLAYIDAVRDAGNPPAYVVDPLVHIKLVGDPYPGAFAQGHTMRGSPSNDAFTYAGQTVKRVQDRDTVTTQLKSRRGYRIEHCISWAPGQNAAEIRTAFYNDSPQPVVLEMLSSFSLSGITPFDPADAAGRLRVHRFRSGWSAEARLESVSMEELHLERSWSGAAMFSERFGQVGSMPVRKWFPFVAIEDTVAGVVWGAQLGWAGSWQMEVFRQHDDVCLSGGLADREFGHWRKTVGPGECLFSPPAYVGCVCGPIDEICDRLTALQHLAADMHPAVERDLPIVFNEWCTTWGDPAHDKIVAIADRLQGTPAKYLVIDAGWYKGGAADWDNGHGDWIPSSQLFPEGIEATAKAIRARGLIPGLWFEMETCGESSAAFSLDDQMLTRDGMPVTVRSRRFWNLSDRRAVDYLSARVIGLLERCGFGYLKVDYNETIGIGCDDPDSLGEGLRKQVEGIYRFFERIRQRLPDLVIENCSSGGHRLEPSMLARSAMSSFSDAHELVEIPIIAANLHRLILPRQSQIWAVLHRSDSEKRLIYSLAATFLGRMCLSGEISELSDRQWQLVMEAQNLYRAAAPIIKYGVSRRFGHMGPSWRYPKGWQAIVRTSSDGEFLLVVAHAFENAPGPIEIPLPEGSWTIVQRFPENVPFLAGESLTGSLDDDFSAAVLILELERQDA